MLPGYQPEQPAELARRLYIIQKRSDDDYKRLHDLICMVYDEEKSIPKDLFLSPEGSLYHRGSTTPLNETVPHTP